MCVINSHLSTTVEHVGVSVTPVLQLTNRNLPSVCATEGKQSSEWKLIFYCLQRCNNCCMSFPLVLLMVLRRREFMWDHVSCVLIWKCPGTMIPIVVSSGKFRRSSLYSQTSSPVPVTPHFLMFELFLEMNPRISPGLCSGLMK